MYVCMYVCMYMGVYIFISHPCLCLFISYSGVDESIEFAFSTQQCLFFSLCFLIKFTTLYFACMHACMWSHFNLINVILIGLAVYHVTLFLSVDFLSVEKVSHDAV